jgi:hypothetical protein
MNYTSNFGSDEGIFMMHNTWPSFLNGCVFGKQTFFSDIHLHNASCYETIQALKSMNNDKIFLSQPNK